MALLTVNKPLEAAETTIVKVDANASPHTFAYNSYNQVIHIENNEAVPLTFNFLGDGITSYTCPEYGTIDVSGGLDVVVAAGEVATLYTRAREAYMGQNGGTVDVTITGSTAADLAYIWIEQY